MSSQPTRKSRLAWIIPATIAAIIFIGGVAGNLIAEDLKNFYNSHRKPVWAVFALALVATIAGVIWDHFRNRNSKPPGDKDHQDVQSQVTISGGVSGSQIANVTASQNPGNVAGRDINITNIQQSPLPTPIRFINSRRRRPISRAAKPNWPNCAAICNRAWRSAERKGWAAWERRRWRSGSLTN